MRKLGQAARMGRVMKAVAFSTVAFFIIIIVLIATSKPLVYLP